MEDKSVSAGSVNRSAHNTTEQRATAFRYAEEACERMRVLRVLIETLSSRLAGALLEEPSEVAEAHDGLFAGLEASSRQILKNIDMSITALARIERELP
jgi:hypothetical protein